MQSELTPKKDFREFLKKEFVKKCQDNPKYSLRAFAKKLNMSHATLSHLVRGKRPLTAQTILYLAKALGLSPRQLAQFHIPSGRTNHKVKENLKFQPIELDTFEVVSDWYHDAILELTKVKQFKSDTAWIAKVLGISKREVSTAIKRLECLKLLKTKEKDKWLDESQFNTTIKNDFTTVALRKLQRQVLEKALVALEQVPYEKRDQSSVTLSINSHDFPQIKKIICDFRRKLSHYLQKKGSVPTQVYQLGISFYPLTNIQEEVQ